MTRMLKITALLWLGFVSAANAQVRQSGTVTSGHATKWVGNGVVGDAGTAASGSLTSIGVTASGSGICQNSDLITAAGYQRFCMGVTTAGGGVLSIQNFGTAAASGISFNVNGAAAAIVTATGPFTANDVACYTNTAGNLGDCGLKIVSGTVTDGVWEGTPIDLSHGGTGATSASGARTALGLGTLALQNSSNVTITGGLVTGMPSPTANSDVATKAYVDATSAGLRIQPQVRLATTAVLPQSPSYANGASGVGATLTAGSNAAIVIDGVTGVSADRVLVKTQAAPAQNGCYTVTTVGDGSTPWVLTRCTDFDTAAEMLAGSYFFATAGTANASSSFVLSGTVTTVGTTAANFYTFSSALAAVTSIDSQTGAFTCAASMDCATGTLNAVGGSTANVKDSTYGALGNSNGTTGNGADDTTAFQAAFNASGRTVGGANYRTVYVPCGTYRITDTITGNSAEVAYRIYGEGQCSQIYLDAGSGKSAFSFTSPATSCGGNSTVLPCVTVERLYFTTPTTPANSWATTFVANVGTRFANNLVVGYGGGVRYTTSYGGEIVNNTFLGILAAAIDLTAAADTSANIFRIWSNGIYGSGVTAGTGAIRVGPGTGSNCSQSVNGTSIIGNDISYGYIGVILYGVCSGTLQSNYMEGNSVAPFFFSTGFNSAISVTDNWLAENTTSSITNVTGLRMENNVLNETKFTRGAGVSAWTLGYNRLEGTAALPNYCTPSMNCSYMNSGEIAQWGSATTSAATPGVVAVTYPIACPNAVLTAVASSNEGTALYKTGVGSITVTGMNVYTETGPVSVNWQIVCR